MTTEKKIENGNLNYVPPENQAEDKHFLEESSEAYKDSNFNDCTNQGLAYIAGFLARKFKDTLPHLGRKSCEIGLLEQTSSPWLILLSQGGLTVLSEEMLSFCQTLEGHFKQFHDFHKDFIDKNPNVFERLHLPLIQKYPDWPKELIIAFVKTRTHIRVKYLNHTLKLKNANVRLRKLKQIGQFTN